MARYLYIKEVGGRRVFRRVLPVDLAARLGKREIVRSLGSLPFEEAHRQARAMAVATDRLIDMARRRPELTPEELRDLAWEGLAALNSENLSVDHAIPTVSRDGKVIDTGPTQRRRKPTGELLEDVDNAQNLASAIGQDNWAESTATGMFGPLAAALLKDAGHSAERENFPGNPSDEAVELARLLLRANVLVHKAREAESRGDYEFDPKDPAFKGATLTVASVPRLSVAWEEFSADRISKKRWQPDQVRASSNARRLLLRWGGDKKINRYTKAELHSFLDDLRMFPADYGQKGGLGDKAFDDIVNEGKARKARTLSEGTLHQHAIQTTMFFNWASKRGMISKNPADELVENARITTPPDEQREAWEDEDVLRLFKSPIWTGRLRANVYSKPGLMIVRDHLYWIPLILAFHHARSEEIAQLRVADIKQRSGVWYFNITKLEEPEVRGLGLTPKKVKNRASIRMLPIHSALVELGFLEYVEKLRAEGTVRVFPALNAGGSALRLTKQYSSTFSTYRKKIGIRRELTLHGLRHTVETKLQDAEVDSRKIDRLAGHTIQGMAGRYGKKAPLPVLKEATEKLQYPGLDIAKLRALADKAAKK